MQRSISEQLGMNGQTGGVAQVVEHLLCKALNSNPICTKKKKKKKKHTFLDDYRSIK
jgi:hypothetical protein